VANPAPAPARAARRRRETKYYRSVIRRLYIHNFRCFENFELPLAGRSSALLIGKNGTGKSTVGLALEILQKIARGTNRVDELLKPKDLARGRTEVPIRFEIEAEIQATLYLYTIAFELPKDLRALHVLEEKLLVGGQPVYSRAKADVHLGGFAPDGQFRIDWRLAALPIVQEQSRTDPLYVFKQWLSHMLVLRPLPSLITGESEGESLLPDPQVSKFGEWFAGLLASAPAAYGRIEAHLRQLMPDLEDITNPPVAKDARSIAVQFSSGPARVSIPFQDLSDGEKCYMICALVLAAHKAYGPLVCYWDEPDSHLGLSEVGHLVLELRRTFQSQGQLIATSHNPEAIRSFSDENTFVLSRRNHLEPTVVRPLSDLQVNGDLVNALIRGDVE
jgi:predicted ATPase